MRSQVTVDEICGLQFEAEGRDVGYLVGVTEECLRKGMPQTNKGLKRTLFIICRFNISRPVVVRICLKLHSAGFRV